MPLSPPLPHRLVFVHKLGLFLILHPLLNEFPAGIKISRRNIYNLRYVDTTIMAESEGELKSLLMRVKEENEKPGLKFNIKKKKS